MNITVTKDITDEILTVFKAVKSIQNDFICIGGFMQEGFRDATKVTLMSRIDDFIKEIDNVDVGDIIENMED